MTLGPTPLPSLLVRVSNVILSPNPSHRIPRREIVHVDLGLLSRGVIPAARQAHRRFCRRINFKSRRKK